jgi:hypothetical protein
MPESTSQLPPIPDEVKEQAQRAEQLLGDWSRRAARSVAAAAARAREEAEDMLAEAQSIRRGERQ